MLQQGTCEDTNNTANMISALIATGLFVVSEILPFVKSQSNGVLHSIILVLRKKFPMSEETPIL